MSECSVPGTTADVHDWMICGELEKSVHISWATKWIQNISLFRMFVGQQGSPRALC